ncbi:hypothetical protein DESC_320051 [Desulfosarcina cetonica]|nr:hypothetical protein DESC_320051 [Desulfosarcina cetonica]
MLDDAGGATFRQPVFHHPTFLIYALGHLGTFGVFFRDPETAASRSSALLGCLMV